MTPPETPEDGPAKTGNAPPAVFVCPSQAPPAPLPRPQPRALTVLRKRADFLRAARGLRQGCKGMMVQARKRAEDEAEVIGIRVGFTCSKKVGNAVARNRAKRRLREVARLVLPEHGRPGWDYVLIGRRDKTADRPFDALQDDLKAALAKFHPTQ